MKKIDEIIADFPILGTDINDNKLIYLDNGASTQKPNCVIDKISDFYRNYNANVHRGVHSLSMKATSMMEDSRKIIKEFINAKYSEEIIFTSGTTEGINIISNIVENIISKNDEIIISELEHHSNIVPWKMLCDKTGAQLKVIPIDENGDMKMSEFDKILSSKTKIVAINHISNTLGTINPIKKIIQKSHDFGALVLVDGAQSIAHMKVDVIDLDVDFFVFSGHKIYAPTGTGVLYGKKSLLNSFPPYKGGGEMIDEVSFDKITYADLPHRLEAGTPNIAGNIALATAIEYVQNIGFDFIENHENELLEYATNELLKIQNLQIIGTAKNKIAIISFVIKELHPFDIGSILDKFGVAVRTGNHCTQPIMARFCIPGTVRATFSIYNTKNDVDELCKALRFAVKMLS